MSKDNYDPNPQASEVTYQKVLTINGVQKIVETTRDAEVIEPSQIVLKEPINHCQAPNYGGVQCEGELHVAHILTRQYRVLSAKSENRLKLCIAHERFFNQLPITVWFRYVKREYPEKFAYVQKKYSFIIQEYETFMHVAYEE